MRTFTLFVLICLPLLNSGSNVDRFADRQRRFAASIFQKVSRTSDRNVFFSPLSLEIILALIQNGAKGETALQIKNALNLPEDPSSLVKSVLEALESDEDYTLHTANKIYVADGVPLVDNFTKIAKVSYHAGLQNVNFSDSDAAAKTINQWVESQTANKIQNLIKPSALSSDTIAVLVNALYFKSSWYNAFVKQLTKKNNFYNKDYSITKVDTMSQDWFQDPLKFSENYELNAQFLEIPLNSEEAQMVVVLPKQLNGIHILEQNMEKVLAPQVYRDEYLTLNLPKFKIETETTLNPILQEMGITKIFNKDVDLSGLSGRKGELAVSLIVQKGFIEVDEKGLEAAVATYATVNRILGGRPNKVFDVNHPFIFYIKVRDVILFIGKVVDPTL